MWIIWNIRYKKGLLEVNEILNKFENILVINYIGKNSLFFWKELLKKNCKLYLLNKFLVKELFGEKKYTGKVCFLISENLVDLDNVYKENRKKKDFIGIGFLVNNVMISINRYHY